MLGLFSFHAQPFTYCILFKKIKKKNLLSHFYQVLMRHIFLIIFFTTALYSFCYITHTFLFVTLVTKPLKPSTLPYNVSQRGTTHVLWLKGSGPLTSLAGLQVGDAKITGMSRTEMLRVHHPKPQFPPDAWQYEVRSDHVQVPNVETTYWCRVQKLPDSLRRK